MNGTQIHDVPGCNDVSGKHDVDRGSPVSAEEIGRCSSERERDCVQTSRIHRIKDLSAFLSAYVKKKQKERKISGQIQNPACDDFNWRVSKIYSS